MFVATIGCGSSDRPLGSGGGAGTGGSGGRGGASAVGGAGGSNAGGRGGSDAGADGAESCQQLMDDYTRATVPASACTVGAADQCQQVSLILDCTACYFLAQDTTTLDALRARLLAQGCITPGNCLCPALGNSMCVPVDAGSGSGSCGFLVN